MDQSDEMTCVSDDLKSEIADSRRNQAELLSHVDELLRRLDEKEYVLSNLSTESDELVVKENVQAKEAGKRLGPTTTTEKNVLIELSKCIEGGIASQHVVSLGEFSSRESVDARDDEEECVGGADEQHEDSVGGDLAKDVMQENYIRPIGDVVAMPALAGPGDVDEADAPTLINLTVETPRPVTPSPPDEAKTPRALATPELPISVDSASAISPNFDHPPLVTPKDLEQRWEEKNAVGRELLSELVERLRRTEGRLSSTTKQNREMARRLAEARGGNAELRAEVAQLRKIQSDLLDHLGKLLERLGEKDDVLSVTMMEKNQLAEKLARAAGLNDRIASQEATSLQGVVEDLEKENQSLHEQINNLIESEIRDAQAGLLRATSAAEEAERTIASLRDEVRTLREENDSLRERPDERGGGASDAPALASASPPRPASSAATSPINFEDASETRSVARIPDGYRGLDWDNFGVMHRSARRSSGFERGIVSGDYVAFNGGGRPCSVSSATPFSVAGFHATAAYNEGSSVLVEGFDGGGKLVGSRRATLGSPRDGPTFVDLRGGKGSFEGLRRLRITTSCGANAIQGNSRSGVAIDHVLVYSDL